MNRELTITEQWTEHKENVEALAAKARKGTKRRGGGHEGRRPNRELTITERWTEHKENAEALTTTGAREGAKRRHSELGGTTDTAKRKRQTRHMTA